MQHMQGVEDREGREDEGSGRDLRSIGRWRWVSQLFPVEVVQEDVNNPPTSTIRRRQEPWVSKGCGTYVYVYAHANGSSSAQLVSACRCNLWRARRSHQVEIRIGLELMQGRYK